MTEVEWLAGDDPFAMLGSLRGRSSDRKLRLFAVACCQRLLGKVRLHPWYAHGVGMAERYAEGTATAEELERVRHYPPPEWCRRHAPRFDQKDVAGQSVRVTKLAINACWNAMEVEDGILIADGASTNAAWAATQPEGVMPDDGIRAARLAAERAVQANILRDIAGNPFRPETTDSAWLTPTVVRLASGIYADLAFDRLPILADALEEAGCDRLDILTHCRGPGPHVRGCWVVDLTLGLK